MLCFDDSPAEIAAGMLFPTVIVVACIVAIFGMKVGLIAGIVAIILILIYSYVSGRKSW